MNENEFDKRPWAEEQWEEFMIRSDIRAAKYGELLETFMDDPDCDEIIAREMGWDEPDEESAEEDVALINSITEAALHDEEIQEFVRRRKEDLHALPAYSRGFEFGLRCHNALRPYVQEDVVNPDDELISAFSNCLIIAAKIAAGHGMGYHDDVLCGNIVNCKRSLAAADKTLATLESLKARGLVPPDVLDPLIVECWEVRQLVADRITELRSRVWWG